MAGLVVLALLTGLCAANDISSRPSTNLPQRFDAGTYALEFRRDGRCDLLVRRSGGDALLCTVGPFEFGELRTTDRMTIEHGPATMAEAEKVHVANVATDLESGAPGWPQVRVNFETADAHITGVWTLAPEVARVAFEITLPDGVALTGGPSTLNVELAKGARLLERIKPARWYHHGGGGVPYQRTAGMADRYEIGDRSLVVANDHGFDDLLRDGRMNLYVRKVQRPWQTDQLQAHAAFAVTDAPVAMPLAIAWAGGDRLLLDVSSPQPFYVWEKAGEPMVVTATAINLFHAPLRVDVEFVARDLDGRGVAQGSDGKMLHPFEAWAMPIRVVADRAGPVYLDVTARHHRACAFQRTCLGILAQRTFLDEKSSRFGISAYRGDVGPHTAFRSEEQVLDLIRRMGVRWLRMASDRKLAHAMGFQTWYHNNISGPAANDYWAGKPTWMDDLKNREDYLAGNLQRTLDQGDECFEFTNEWNLYGGEEKGVLAERYGRDWAIPLKRLRDQVAPSVKLAGCVIANGDLVFLDKVYQSGGWDQFERLAFHASGTPRSPDFDDGQTYWSYLATLRRLHEALRRYGRKELWMTEFYAPAAPNSSCSNNERVAAEDLTLMCALAVAADVRGFMYYCLDDFDRDAEIKTSKEIGEPSERECYFGLVRRDWCPKAGLWAYQTAAYYFDGARFVGDIDLGDPDVHGVLFDGHRGRFGVLWSRQEGYLRHEPAHPRTTHRESWEPFWTVRTPIVIAPIESEITVVDCVGNERRISAGADGKARFELTGAAVYVLGGRFDACAGRFSKMFHSD